MAKVLYRGISNVCQLSNILNRQTAGGWEQNDISFEDYLNKNPDIPKSIIHQSGSEAERLPLIVCIDDTKDTQRSVIEYTTDESVAAGFGLIGYICIEIDDKYVEKEEYKESEGPEKEKPVVPKTKTPIGSERSIYCLSSAPIVILGIYIYSDFKAECHVLKRLLGEYKTIKREFGKIPPIVRINCKRCEFK